METNEIIKLMEAMSETGIDLLELSVGASQLKLKRHPKSMPFQSADAQTLEYRPVLVDTIASQAEAEPIDPANEYGDSVPISEETPGAIVTAPVVGIFFSAPSPDAPPFTEVGKEVKNGDVVCIIEAMKLMNEVSSTASGKVLEVYVQNGQKVQYGDPLFRIG